MCLIFHLLIVYLSRVANLNNFVVALGLYRYMHYACALVCRLDLQLIRQRI